MSAAHPFGTLAASQQGLVNMSPMRKPKYLGWWIAAAFPVVFFGWAIVSFIVLSHDKSVNSEIGILWEAKDRVPLGVVIPSHNRWISHAFIADVSVDPLVQRSVMIIDDHYQSGDPTLRSQSGIIGDPMRPPLLCTLPSQCKAKSVELDPAVVRLVQAEC